MIGAFGSLFVYPKVLNSNALLVNVVDTHSISQKLHKIILNLYGNFLNEDGSVVDYQGIANSEEFREFEQTTFQLHNVALEMMSEVERKVFFINLYNTGMIHATIRHNPPTNFLSRLKFFAENGYYIGPHFFSLNDIENGILRNNGINPVSGSPQFGTRDPRKAFMVTLDPRIHFALVCGAKSCPPIRIFSIENCDNALQLAAKNYCKNNVQILEHSVVVSPIFKWYASDFGKEPRKIMEYISQFVDEEDAEKMRAVAGSNHFHIKYFNYDWSVNSSI